MINNYEAEKLVQKSIVNGVDIGVLITNEEDTIVWANDAFCQILDVSYGSIDRTSAISLLDLDPFGHNSSQFRVKTKRSNGDDVWLTCFQAHEATQDNTNVYIRYFIDISDLQRRQKMRLAVSSGFESSRMDPETGVLNRRTIIQELNTEISRSRRYENPLSAILIQYSTSSALSEVNEQAIASAINSELRWVDIIGSLSKGCFLIILPESAMSGAEQAWHKISVVLESLIDEKQYQVSYSDWQKDNNADEFIARLQSSLQISKVA